MLQGGTTEEQERNGAGRRAMRARPAELGECTPAPEAPAPGRVSAPTARPAAWPTPAGALAAARCPTSRPRAPCSRRRPQGWSRAPRRPRNHRPDRPFRRTVVTQFSRPLLCTLGRL